MKLFSLVVSFIFSVNFTIFLICEGRPWITENDAVEESGNFELQPRFIVSWTTTFHFFKFFNWFLLYFIFNNWQFSISMTIFLVIRGGKIREYWWGKMYIICVFPKRVWQLKGWSKKGYSWQNFEKKNSQKISQFLWSMTQFFPWDWLNHILCFKPQVYLGDLRKPSYKKYYRD